MPVHDWSRVSAGVFHDFHNTWIVELKNALNGGVLPAAYYAMSEQRAGLVEVVVPDHGGGNLPLGTLRRIFENGEVPESAWRG